MDLFDSDSDSYENETLGQGDLPESGVSGKEFSSCRFERCDFTEADLSASRFEGCRFVACNFSNPVIKRARFADAVFEECKIVGVNFYACDQLVFDIKFDRCRLLNCNFSDLKMKNSRFTLCELRGCDFQNTHLVGAAFDGSTFAETLFHSCDLEKASFRGARGYSIDPRANKIAKAVFSVPEVISLIESFGIVIEDADRR